MSITDDLTILKEERDQRIAAFRVRALILRFHKELETTNADIQGIVDKGHFDTIPASIKVELSQAWNLMKACYDSIEADSGIVEVLNWSP